MFQLGLQKACWSHQRKMDNFLANVSWNTQSSHLTTETVSPEGIFSVIASIVVLSFFVISHVRLTCFQVKIHHGCTSTLRSRQRTPNALQAAHSKRTPGSALPMHSRQHTPNALQWCTHNALRWCTCNALQPHLNICTRTPNALQAVHSQCTPGNALPMHSRQRTPNALHAMHSKRTPVMHSQRTPP